MIYTIGYQKIPVENIANISKDLDAFVIDVRARPTSRKPGYSRGKLESLLGDRYIWAGDRLGGGQISPEGIEYLRTFEHNCILMCLEQNPLDCHRLDIAKMLKTEVFHIYNGVFIETEDLKEGMCDGVVYYDWIDSVLPLL